MKISGTPRKSFSDKKEYKVLKLRNGLKVLLVNQQPENVAKGRQNLAAVALCVASGCFEDPFDVQGLSHFLEHMIFMGSQKYPEENEFDRYVSEHGGYDNAYTECEHTLLHFDIIEKHLAGALDRFAQFFIAPLMTTDSMEREMQAIESEFQANTSDDDVRVSQIYCSMVQDWHPASNFIWGNLKTLRDGIEKKKLHALLHDFRKRKFVANRMFLCVQSSVDVIQLEKTVAEFFTDIPNGDDLKMSETPQSIFEAFKPSFFEKISFVKSTTERCKLLITFLFPSNGKEVKFLEYIAYLTQFEGAGSLTDLLMHESLALRVTSKVGSQNFEGNSKFTFFTIEINLTSNGFRNIDKVLEVIFAYLLLLKTTSLEEHKKIFEELRDIQETLFRYRNEKSAIENVQELAVNMRYFDDQDIIVGREKCPEFDEVAMKKAIEGINKNQFNMLILSDKFKNYDKIEKWFGTEYAEIDIPQRFTKLWNERWLRQELFLPNRNDFVCTNFEVFSDQSNCASSAYPSKIFSNCVCECFYKCDEKFKLPHGLVSIQLRSAVTESSVKNLNMTSILSMCVKNFLSDQLYPATIAGYNYKLHSVDDGLLLRVSGFSEKLPLIIQVVTKAIKSILSFTEKNAFETFKRELKKNCRNCLINKNLLNDDVRLSVLKRHHRTFFDRYDNVDRLSLEDFKGFCELFANSMKVKMLVQGNFVESHALHIVEKVIDNLNLVERDGDEETFSEANQIPLGSSVLRIPSINRNDSNSNLKNYYQVGKASMLRDECFAELIVSAMNEPLFDALRNRDQLGYGVSCALRKSCGVLGITITVEYQENRNSAQVIDNKIEEFLINFHENLKLLSDAEFLSAKQSIVALKHISDNDLQKEFNRNWEEIRIGENCFDRNEREAFELESIVVHEVVDFYQKTFLIEARKLSVRVIGNTDFENFDFESSKPNFLNQLREFKNNLDKF